MNFEEDIRRLSSEEIRKGLSVGRWGFANSDDTRKYNLAKLILEERMAAEDKKRLDKSLKIMEDNVKTTNKLVIATWGLVIVTAILSFNSLLTKLIAKLI